MRRILQAAAILVVALGAFVAREGHLLGVESRFGAGPGAGFFAFWIGLALALLGVLWLAQVTLRPVAGMPDDFIPDREGLARLGIVVLALCVFAAALAPLGFNVSMFLFLLVLFFTFDRSNKVAKPLVAFGASFGVNYVFERFLGVPLPDATIEPLRSLGF